MRMNWTIPSAIRVAKVHTKYIPEILQWIFLPPSNSSLFRNTHTLIHTHKHTLIESTKRCGHPKSSNTDFFSYLFLPSYTAYSYRFSGTKQNDRQAHTINTQPIHTELDRWNSNWSNTIKPRSQAMKQKHTQFESCINFLFLAFIINQKSKFHCCRHFADNSCFFLGGSFVSILASYPIRMLYHTHHTPYTDKPQLGSLNVFDDSFVPQLFFRWKISPISHSGICWRCFALPTFQLWEIGKCKCAFLQQFQAAEIEQN